MRYKPINGWTKAKIIETLNSRPDILCVDSDSNPIFFDEKGNSCAVGVFIPKERRNKVMNELGVSELFNKFPETAKTLPLELVAMCSLQTIHDTMLFWRSDDSINDMLIQWVLKNVKDE